MKRLFWLITAVAIILSLAACGTVEVESVESPRAGGSGEVSSDAAKSETKTETGGEVENSAPDAEPAPTDEGGEVFTEVTGGSEATPGEAWSSAAEAESVPAYEAFAVESKAADMAGSSDVPMVDYSYAEGEYAEPAGEGGEISIEPIIDPIVDPDPYINYGEAFRLTAAEWNDNRNWAFFSNLVSSGRIEFPSFGLDPRNRVKVTVTDGEGNALPNETVTLYDNRETAIFTAVTDKEGVAYLFYGEGELAATVEAGGVRESLVLAVDAPAGSQTPGYEVRHDEVTFVTEPAAPEHTALQVMFIVDTTGSMGDEIAYLQKDFASIAEEVGSDGISYSVNFYRDEGDDYVTKVSEFTDDVDAIKGMIEQEYAAGGGDTPEAVAQILDETLRWDFVAGHSGWREDTNKIAFLIFDAPPHDGTDETIIAAVERAAEMGVRVIPVVASNAERETELFGRALAIMTNGTYVFLTDDSGIGGSHLEPIVGSYDVELLHDVIVRIIEENRA